VGTPSSEWIRKTLTAPATDLVTKTDAAVEETVKFELSQRYPTILFLGEETHGASKLTAAPTFIVDPIDGTTNFVHGLPLVAISLGLSVSRAPTVGVIYNPFTGELFSAIRGRGAWLSSLGGPRAALPLHEPEPLALDRALVAVEWGARRGGNDHAVRARTYEKLAHDRSEGGGGMVHGMRSMGSAALNLCAVSAGRLDAYWEAGCWAWDVCAGLCILAETGGVCVDANPGTWTAEMDGRRFLAVRGEGDKKRDERGVTEGQGRFIEEFWGCVEGRFEVSAESAQ
jgi:myo-inositol-1(or 4)-monophosphatase